MTLITEVEKLDSNKLNNVSTGLNNLKTKVNDLDVVKMKTVPVDLKKLSDLLDNEIAENTLKKKVNKKNFLVQLLYFT